MKKLYAILSAAIVAISAYGAENGLLWKISGNGASRPSYVLGSHHLAPTSFIDSIVGLKEAIGLVDIVYGEVAKDALSSPQAQQLTMSAAMAPADSTLSKVLSPTDYALVDSVMAIYAGQRGMLAQLEMLKPSFVSVQLTLLQNMASTPGFNPMQQFDTSVMELGEQAGKPVAGLETFESQINLLFGDPIATQAKDLVEAARKNDKLIDQTRRLSAAYLAQDLDAINAVMTDPEVDMTPDELDRLLYDRNREWAKQLDTILRDKSVFLVVGAGHLGGDQGLLNLLKNNGFTVEPIH